MMVVAIVIVLDKFAKGWVQGLEELEIKRWVETIQTKTFSR